MNTWKKIGVGLGIVALVLVPVMVLTINENNKSIERYPLNSYTLKDGELIFDVYIPSTNEVTGTYSIPLPNNLIIGKSDQLAINPRMKSLFDDERKIQEIKNIFINGKIVWASTANSKPIETKYVPKTVEQVKLEIVNNPTLDQAAKDYVLVKKNACKNVTTEDKINCKNDTLLQAYKMSHEFVNKVEQLLVDENQKIEVKTEVKK